MKTGLLRMAVAVILAADGNHLAAADPPQALPLPAVEQPQPLSPTALAVTPDGARLFVACATANCVLVFDTASKTVTRSVSVPASPLGLVLSKDGRRLYVACAAPRSIICVVDTVDGRIVGQVPAGHTAMAPVLSPDGKTLYVCNRFDHDVSFIDLASGREMCRVRVEREPVAAAVTPDGALLLVANHMHAGTADNWRVAAAVSVIQTASGRTAKHIRLPEGSGLLRGLAISPDGRWAAVTWVRAHYYLPTTEVDLGRINCNALSVLDLGRLKPHGIRLLGTVLLDTTVRGAANPWAVAWSADGKTIAVTHAGTHEVSLIDLPLPPDSMRFFSLFLGQTPFIPPDAPPRKPVRVRHRVALPGNGPRALAVSGSTLYVANYFSDNLCRIDLTEAEPAAEPMELAPTGAPSLARQGEQYFNDATLCRQGWQSCASCHDADARMDGLNWDLLNDGVGNPKSTRSLLWAHLTPPAMWLGVRNNATVAVRAGIRHILFSDQPEEVPAAIDAYLKSLQPIPSPRLVNGTLSAAAERGKETFMSCQAGCAHCHPPPLFTDLKAHDVGTCGLHDQPDDRFYTPPLVELWRTAPYLHDGSAATLRDVLIRANLQDRHGKTSHLTDQQVDDLAEYLLSL